jgi:hypothetical protein
MHAGCWRAAELPPSSIHAAAPPSSSRISATGPHAVGSHLSSAFEGSALTACGGALLSEREPTPPTTNCTHQCFSRRVLLRFRCRRGELGNLSAMPPLPPGGLLDRVRVGGGSFLQFVSDINCARQNLHHIAKSPAHA